MKKALAIAAVAAIALSAPAFANDDDAAHMEQKADYYMKKIDTNGDGAISADEHKAFAEGMFKSADKDGNGSVSRQELIDAKTAEKKEMEDAMGEKH